MVPHEPQLFGSLAVFEQMPEHIVSAQAHEPPTQS